MAAGLRDKEEEIREWRRKEFLHCDCYTVYFLKLMFERIERRTKK